MLGNDRTGKPVWASVGLNPAVSSIGLNLAVTLVDNPGSVVIDQGAEPHLHLTLLYSNTWSVHLYVLMYSKGMRNQSSHTVLLSGSVLSDD